MRIIRPWRFSKAGIFGWKMRVSSIAEFYVLQVK